MTDKEKSREELLLELHKLEKLSKNRPRVLPSRDEVFLLDPTNPHDARWFEEDKGGFSMDLETSRKILNGEFDYNRTWHVAFEYKRDYEKHPLSQEENQQILDDLIQVFQKHGMEWKLK